MNLTDQQRLEISAAMGEIEAGDRAGFEWSLWLTFGDEWTRVRDVLLGKGFVIRTGSRGDGLGLTTRGRTFRERMTARAAATTASANPGDGDAASKMYELAAG